MLNFDDINGMFEKYGYEANGQLVAHTLINLHKAQTEGAKGQGIQAICLDGPPGAGKTFYAKTYKKVLQDILGEKVQFLQYQCDTTTGKSELNEEINIANAITGNADEVIIPGFLTQAIKKVIDGERVVLFLDEYDKAREETDSFLLDFLQSGRVNTVQGGDLQIPKDKLKNLQVILCKNDVREELTGPLERRLKMIPLNYMKPEVFLKVLSRNREKANILPGEDMAEIEYIVAVMYQLIYEKRENFSRVPACSELLIAIQDAKILMTSGASTRDVMEIAFLDNVLKNPDDRQTFLSYLKSSPINYLTNMFTDDDKCDFSNYLNQISIQNGDNERHMLTIEINAIKSVMHKENMKTDELSRKLAELEAIDITEDQRIMDEWTKQMANITSGTTRQRSTMASRDAILTEEKYLIGKMRHERNDPKFSKAILKLAINGGTIHTDGILLAEQNGTKVVAIPTNDGYDIVTNQYVWDDMLVAEVEAFASKIGANFEYSNTIVKAASGPEEKKLVVTQFVNKAINKKQKSLGVDR